MELHSTLIGPVVVEDGPPDEAELHEPMRTLTRWHRVRTALSDQLRGTEAELVAATHRIVLGRTGEG